MRAIEQRHPQEPHWYLAVLGTDPAHWGQGVGSALVRHVLDDPANGGQAAYLETETESNVPFYERHGFQVVGELDVPRGGPHLWLMWRDPPNPSDRRRSQVMATSRGWRPRPRPGRTTGCDASKFVVVGVDCPPGTGRGGRLANPPCWPPHWHLRAHDDGRRRPGRQPRAG